MYWKHHNLFIIRQSPPDEQLYFSNVLNNTTNTVMNNLHVISCVQESVGTRSGITTKMYVCVFTLKEYMYLFIFIFDVFNFLVFSCMINSAELDKFKDLDS